MNIQKNRESRDLRYFYLVKLSVLQIDLAMACKCFCFWLKGAHSKRPTVFHSIVKQKHFSHNLNNDQETYSTWSRPCYIYELPVLTNILSFCILFFFYILLVNFDKFKV